MSDTFEHELIRENKNILELDMATTRDRAHWQRAAYHLAETLAKRAGVADPKLVAQGLVEMALADTEKE